MVAQALVLIALPVTVAALSFGVLVFFSRVAEKNGRTAAISESGFPVSRGSRPHL